MKFYFTLIFCLCLQGLFAQASVFNPDVQWKVLDRSISTDSNRQVYHLASDSVFIQGHYYRAVEGGSTNTSLLFRESEDVVWAYDSLQQTEFLFYDYTLEIGDTFWNVGNDFTIVDTTYVELGRKVLELSCQGGGQVVWVEGLGSLAGFQNHLISCGQTPFVMTCVWQESEMLWEHPQYLNACFEDAVPSLFDTGTVWTMFFMHYENSDLNYYKDYYFNYQNFEECNGHRYYNFEGRFYRRDLEGKVYQLLANEKEQLYYDISMEIGDTLWYEVPHLIDSTFIYITDVDTVSFEDGVPRRRLEICRWTEPNYIVEGLYDLLGFDMVEGGCGLSFAGGAGQEMVCVRNRDGIIYNPSGGCFVTTVQEEPPQLSVFPNPVQTILNISGEYQSSPFEILNISGQTVQSGVIQSNSIQLDNLSSGMYFLNVFHQNQWIKTKIIKL